MLELPPIPSLEKIVEDWRREDEMLHRLRVAQREANEPVAPHEERPPSPLETLQKVFQRALDMWEQIPGLSALRSSIVDGIGKRVSPEEMVEIQRVAFNLLLREFKQFPLCNPEEFYDKALKLPDGFVRESAIYSGIRLSRYGKDPEQLIVRAHEIAEQMGSHGHNFNALLWFIRAAISGIFQNFEQHRAWYELGLKTEARQRLINIQSEFHAQRLPMIYHELNSLVVLFQTARSLRVNLDEEKRGIREFFSQVNLDAFDSLVREAIDFISKSYLDSNKEIEE